VYSVNPPLTRAIGASPAALLGPEPLWELAKENEVDRPEFRLGANYAYHFGGAV
jgi:hypothetical protein